MGQRRRNDQAAVEADNMTTKVFVSHSAKSDEHKQLLAALVDELSALGLEPWVDYQGIEPGDDWNDDITQALHQCHAAVILFSAQALLSPFVKYEVSCLAYRKRTDPGFGLFPVIIDDIQVDKVTEDFFGAIRFGDYQIGRLDEKRAILLDKLQQLDPLLTEPTSAIEGQLFRWFEGVAPEVIRRAAGELEMDILPGVSIPEAERLLFVRWLLSESLSNQIKALNEIKGTLPKPIEQIFELIAPCWVDSEAAQQLAAIRKAEPGKRCAIINGSEAGFTCEQFLKRVYPFKDSDILGAPEATQGEQPAQGLHDTAQLLGGHSPIGRGGAQALIKQVRNAICHRLNLDPSSPQVTEQVINEELEFLETEGRRYLIDELKLNAFQLSSIAQLADRYQRVTFVALTGQEEVPNLPAGLKDRAQIIKPLLVSGDSVRHNETYAYKRWKRRQSLLGI